MDNVTFGARVRELRRIHRYSLRQLAQAAEIDFTYLSKLETGRFPPPSEEVIARLAEVLEIDKDELLALADKVDSSIRRFIVSEPSAPKLLRALKDQDTERVREIILELEKREGNAETS